MAGKVFGKNMIKFLQVVEGGGFQKQTLTEEYLDKFQMIIVGVSNFSLSDRLRHSREMSEQMIDELKKWN